MWLLAGRFLSNLYRIGHAFRTLACKLNDEQNREPFVFQNWREIPKHPPTPRVTGVVRHWRPQIGFCFAPLKFLPLLGFSVLKVGSSSPMQ